MLLQNTGQSNMVTRWKWMIEVFKLQRDNWKMWFQLRISKEVHTVSQRRGVL